MHFTKVARLADVPERGGLAVQAAGRAIALFRAEGGVHAIEDRCPHQFAPLSEGTLANLVITSMAKMLKRLLGEDVELAMTLARALHAVFADAGQIEQVVMNLAVNARDAMPDGGKLTIETANVDLDEAAAAELPELRPGRHVALTVRDTGHGMDEGTKQHLFEPFFTTKEPGRGTGLGLSTVYGIVKQSGGSILVGSEVGRGTTFRIYLPRVEEPASAGAERESVGPAARGAETVLLVEDEDVVRKLARRTLEAAGYTVLEAARGKEALEIEARYGGAIDLLLTDMVMPGMSGRDLAERLAATRPRVRILFISGHTDRAIDVDELKPGTAFLQKPYTPDGLAAKVREVIDAGTERSAGSASSPS